MLDNRGGGGEDLFLISEDGELSSGGNIGIAADIQPERFMCKSEIGLGICKSKKKTFCKKIFPSHSPFF